MSIIVRPDVLNRVYPADRTDIHVLYNTTTEVAKSEPPPVHRGTIFPYLLPGCSDNASAQDSKRRIDSAEAVNEDTSSGRRRSDSLETLVKAPKAPWNQFASGLRPSQPQPEWSSESRPFAEDIVSDNGAWWRADAERRHEIMEEWDAKTWKVTSKKAEKSPATGFRCLSEKLPEHSVPGVDYELTPSLCDTYVTDRNYNWHRDNVETAQAAEDARKLEKTEAQFQNELKTTKKFYKHFQLAANHVRRYPQDMRAREAFRTIRNNMMLIEDRLEKTKADLRQLRQDSGLRGSALEAGLDYSLSSMTSTKSSFKGKKAKLQQHLSQVQPNPAQAASGEPGPTTHPEAGAPANHGYLEQQPAAVRQVHVASSPYDDDAPSVASTWDSVTEAEDSFTSPENGRVACDHCHVELQSGANKQVYVAPSSHDYTGRDETPSWSSVTETEASTSFPEYEDPALEEAPQQAAVNSYVEKLIIERRASAGRNLANILADTGIHVRQNSTEQLPSEETLVGSSAPVAPADWTNFTKGSRFPEYEGQDAFTPWLKPAIVNEDGLVAVVAA